jgi:SAM-dependent methyltransferase
MSLKKLLSEPGSFPRKLYRTKIGRFVYHFPEEVSYYVHKRNQCIPPPHLIYTGRGDFLTVGREFFGYFLKYGKITPQSNVLDVGCGLGRMALPFIEYLSPTARYHGFDVVKEGPAWCAKHISPRHPNFTFVHVDIYNELYNKKGTIRPADFKFPYAGDAFDFVLLTSVFTHMAPQDIARYVDEISRVLKKAGRVLVTANLLNDDSQAMIARGVSPMKHQVSCGQCYASLDPQKPYDDIALNEQWFLNLLEKAGLKPQLPVLYGNWCGRTTAVSCQDIIIAEKE